MADFSDIKKLTVVSLRHELTKRGLSATGLKQVLVQRLEEALQAEGVAQTDTIDGEGGIDEEDGKEEMTDSEDERGQKRKRMSTPMHPDEVPSSSQKNLSDELSSLYLELKASDKERERLQFMLEEAHTRIDLAKQEARKEAEQELAKERVEMRSQLDLAIRKREELEFRLSQKEDELQEHSASKQTEKRENLQIKTLKEELKKKACVEFQCEQMKEQLNDYKQQVRILQQKIEAMQLNTDREKKEKERCLQEERGKSEAIRVRMESQRDELVKEWRKEFEKKMEEQHESLRQQIRETKKMQKELAEKSIALQGEMADKTRDELQRLADMHADLSEKENQLRENDKLQEELEAALEHRQQSIEEEATRLESDKQEFELTRHALEKERQEFEERLWAVDLDVKRRRDKEKALDDKVMELLGKSEALLNEKATTKEAHAKQIQELTLENERLKNSLALSQARVVSARPLAPSVHAPKQDKQDKQEEDKTTEAPESHLQQESSSSASRQTRSQARSQEQQSRELLLSKTRSRASYIPKPSSRKPADSHIPSHIPVPVSHPLPKPIDNNNNNKENSQQNINGPEGTTATPVDSGAQVARKQRASMIPIRRGSSLLPQQCKVSRG